MTHHTLSSDGGVMKNNITFSLFLLFTASFIGCAYSKPEEIKYIDETPNEPVISVPDKDESQTKSDPIYISVLGEVVLPGVYVVPEGTRIYEVLNEAGGTTEFADLSSINMVTVLNDGMQVVVPKIGETTGKESPDVSLTNIDNVNLQVNINTADLKTLMTLTGIGETRAQAILDYREKNGKFNDIKDIMKVSGIKEKTYEGLKDQICVK